MPLALTAPAAALTLALFSSCTAPAPPTVNFHFEALPPQYYRDRTGAELENMTHKSAGEGMIGGLARNEVRSFLNIIATEAPQIFGDSYCVWPTVVNVNIQLHSTVWVASDYVESSCRYNVAYVHEMLHVKIARDTLNEFMPGIEALIRAKVATLGAKGPMEESAIGAARDAQISEVNALLNSATKRVEMVLDERQAVIDTPEAYQTASNACLGADQQGRR